MKKNLLFATLAILSPLGILAADKFPFQRHPVPVAEHNWTQWTITVKTNNPAYTPCITYDARTDSRALELILEEKTGIAPLDQRWIWHTEGEIKELKAEDADLITLGQQANKGAFMTLTSRSGQKAQKPSECTIL